MLVYKVQLTKTKNIFEFNCTVNNLFLMITPLFKFRKSHLSHIAIIINLLASSCFTEKLIFLITCTLECGYFALYWSICHRLHGEYLNCCLTYVLQIIISAKNGMVYFEVKKMYKSEKRVVISFLEKVIGKQFMSLRKFVIPCQNLLI